ncbi:MAG: hypothetical protein K1X78_26640, partial [Verrucomicrobiaceae bacterium]|nr:hypothetical protein [Verrucomicrobiaceae bacterium]
MVGLLIATLAPAAEQTLVEYDFESITTDYLQTSGATDYSKPNPTAASVVDSCVTASGLAITGPQLFWSQVANSGIGASPSKAGSTLTRCFQNWDESTTIGTPPATLPPTSGRANLNAVAKSINFTVTTNAAANGAIGNLRFDAYRPSQYNSVWKARAYITWQNGASYSTAYTPDATFVNNASGWVNAAGYAFDQPFSLGAALPTGAAIAGKTFLVEIVFWWEAFTGHLTNTAASSNKTDWNGTIRTYKQNTIDVDNVRLFSTAAGFTCSSSKDYGDWNGAGAATATTFSIVDSNLKLGAAVDAEAAPSQGALANGDDTSGSDDEDGVTLPAAPWAVGEAKNVSVVLTNSTGASATLAMWIDFNGDGDFLDAGENVLRASIPTGVLGQTWTYAITPLKAGANLGVRVRLSSDPNVTSTSSVGTGEVEDYTTTITAISANQCYKWTMDNTNEDWTLDPVTEMDPDVTGWTPQINGESFGTIRYATMSYNPTTQELHGTVRIKVYTASNPLQGFWLTLSEGPLPRELNRAVMYYDGSTPSAPKMTIYAYDPAQSQFSWNTPAKLLSSSITDGDLKPGPLVNEGSNYFRVDFSVSLASINDRANYPTYNLPEDWKGMQFGSEVGAWFHFFKFSAAPTYNASGGLLTFPVDETTIDGTTGYKKFIGWFDTGTWPALLKAALATKTSDFGDYAKFASASSTVISTLKIGALTDAEDASTVDATATGDDVFGSDDDDGVTLPASLVPGAAASIVVNVTNTSGASAYLNAWIDYNQNGVLTDAGEQIATNTVVANTTSNSNRTINFTVPAGATLGTTGLRVRLTSVSSPGSTGQSGNGEVEDYVITVANPNVLAVGNLVYIDANDNGRFDTGEGVNGVTVKLFPQGTTTSGTPTATTTTAAVNGINGTYSFTGLAAGNYYVHIPATNFAAGQPLAGQFSMPGAGNDNGKDDDFDENGIDDSAPATYGISSGVFTLASAAEPTTIETGANGAWDDGASGKPADNNADLTIDFGFSPCSQTNLFTNGGFETANPVGLTFPDRFPNTASDPQIAATSSSNATDAAGWERNPSSYINDATHAAEGSRFVYLPTGSCVWQYFGVGTTLPGLATLTPGQAYTITVDWAAFDQATPVTPTPGETRFPAVEFRFQDAAGNNEILDLINQNWMDPRSNTVVTAKPTTAWSALSWQRARYQFVLPPAAAGHPMLRLLVSGRSGTSGNNSILIDNLTLTPACSTQVGSIGSLVYYDLNNNGRSDGSEPGADGALLMLERSVSPGVYETAAYTYTHDGGRYFFPGVSPGTYRVFVPSANFSSSTPWWRPAGPSVLYGLLSSTGNADPNVSAASALDDNAASLSDKGVDNATPASNGIYTPDFVLGLGTEPVTGTGTENGAFKDMDAIADASGDMTIDLGFRPTGTLDFGDWAGGTTPANAGTTTASSIVSQNVRMGAFVDAETGVTPTAAADVDDNTNGDDEDGVIMPGAIIVGSSVTIPVSVFNNNTAGKYLQAWIDFNNDGTFNNTDIASGGERIYNAVTTASASQQTINVTFTVPAGASVGSQRGVRFRYSDNSATTPTSTGATGEIEDYAVNIVASGGCYEMDLVAGTTVTTCTGCFTDSGGTAAAYGNNENYTVTFRTGTTDKMRATFTAFATEATYDVLYVYDGPSTASPLIGTYSGSTLPGTAGVITGSGDSLTFTFTSDGSNTPTGWSANLSCVAAGSLAVGNLVYIDANDNGRFDAGEGVNGVTVKLFPQGTATSGTPTATTTTAAVNGINGCYSFTGLSAGSYYVHIPASNFAAGQPLAGQYSMLGAGNDNGKDDDFDENGIDDAAPATNGISSNVFTLAAGAEPTSAESGQNGTWDDGTAGKPADNNCDLTIDFGFSACAQTNLWVNGDMETPDASVTGFTTAFPNGGSAISFAYNGSGTVPMANWRSVNAGNYINDPTHATSGSKFYYMGAGSPCIIQSFGVGAALAGKSTLTAGQAYNLTFDWVPFDSATPAGSASTSALGIEFIYFDSTETVQTKVLDISSFYDVTANARSTQTPVQSPWSSLNWRRCRVQFIVPPAVAGKPVFMIYLSSYTGKLLVDNVSLTPACAAAMCSVGSVVFNDVNNNGIKDSGEAGIDEVMVNAVDSSTGTFIGYAFTNSGGKYIIPGLMPGSYTINVDQDNFTNGTAWWRGSTNGALVGMLSSTGAGNPNAAVASATDDNVVGGDKGVDAATPATSGGISSAAVTLALGAEPTSGAGASDKENGYAADLDAGADSSGDMTMDFGLLTPATADYGDHSGFGPASSAVLASLKIGATTDSESVPTTNATATGDDTTGGDDEDGVTLPASITPGAATSIIVNVTNSTAASAYLNAWIDYNQNGVLTDAGEQIATNTVVASGTSNSNRTINFTPPAGASLGTAGVRVRLTSTSSPGPTGYSGNGELEDYVVTVNAGTDFGDYNGFASASQAASSNVRFGTAATDAEATDPSNATASGDDGAGTDDEDLVLPSFYLGTNNIVSVPVTLTPAALANGGARIALFADWNHSGTFTSDEISSTRFVSSSGTYDFNLVPTSNSATLGTSYLRLRIAEGTAAPTATGASAVQGEVEDYPVTVVCPWGTILPGWSGANNPVSGGTFDFGYGISGTFSQSVNGWTPAGASLIGHNGPGPHWAGVFNAESLTPAGWDAGTDYGQVTFDFTTPVRFETQTGVALPFTLEQAWQRSNYTITLTGGAVFASENIEFISKDAATLYGVRGTDYSVSGLGTSTLTLTRVGGQADVSTGNDFYFTGWFTISGLVDTISIRQTATLVNNYSLGGYVWDSDAQLGFPAIKMANPNDYGDYPGFPLASNYVSSSLRIGSGTDGEAANPGTGAADADDTTGSDDEDVTMPAFTVGIASNLNVPLFMNGAVSLLDGTARVNVFVDWNGDGDVADASETQTAQTVLGGSTTAVFSLTPPVGTTAGTKYLRIRLVEGSTAPAFSGAGTVKGEVEDYAITVNAATPLELYLGGAFTKSAASTHSGVAGVTTSGVLDGGFTPTNGINAGATVYSVDVLSNGKVVGGGNFTSVNGTARPGIAIWTTTGGLDATFAPTITASSGAVAINQLYVTTGDKIYIVGNFNTVNGTSRNRIARLNADGTLDTTFNPGTGFNSDPTCIAMHSDGDILVGGNLATYNGAAITGLIRINSDGTRDTAFTTPALSGVPYTLYIQPDGKAIACGTVWPGSAYGTARFNLNGTLDTTFNGAGAGATGTAPVSTDSIIQLPDGKFLLGGHFTSYNGTARSYLCRLNSDGTLDTTFTLNCNAAVNKIRAEPGNRYCVIGDFTTIGAVTGANGIMMLDSNLAPIAGYGPLNITRTTMCDVTGVKSTGPSTASDYGDWNGAGALTTTTSASVNANLRIGATVDSEPGVTPDAAATADGADEDGVWFAPSVTVGSYAQLSVKATNLTGAAAYLNAWVDFNNNGTFDAGEQVATNVSVPTGTTNYDPAGYNTGNAYYQYYRLQFLVPATASVGANRGVRVRLSNVLNTPATGASGAGEIEDYVMSFTAPEPCHHFHLADANGDVVFNPATEMTPTPNNAPIYWDAAGDMGSFRDLDATFSPSTKLFTFDCTVQQKNATGVRTDGIWFMINTGPLPLQTPVRRYAMVYLDAFDRTSPKATVYVEDSLQHSGSWSSPAYLMVSTAPGGANAGDVKLLSVTEDTVAKTVRFRFTLDCTRINDRTQWPVAWGLDADWRGLQFLGNAGMWCTATDMTAAPTYDASGKATAMNMSATSNLGIDVHPMGFTPIITEPCLYDYGDHAFTSASSASQKASTDIFVGTNPTDAEGDLSDAGASLDDTTGTNDEDLLLPGFTAGVATNLVIPVTVTPANLSGSTARINVWVDWNGDGDVLDANETLTAQTVNASGNFTFALTPPAATVAGTKYLRVRITEGSTAPAFAGGSALKGEVEDYAVEVCAGGTWGANHLIEWNMSNSPASGASFNPIPPSCLDACVTGGVLQIFGNGGGSPDPQVSDDPQYYNGPSFGANPGTVLSSLRCLRGFDAGTSPARLTTLQAARSSLTGVVSKTWCNFTMGTVGTGSITGFVLDFARRTNTSPDRIQAYLTWNSGGYKTAWTNLTTVPTFGYTAGTPPAITWNTLSLGAFSNGAALPTNAALSGQQFLLELYIYNDTSGGSAFVEVDNLALLGTCSPTATCPPSLEHTTWAYSQVHNRLFQVSGFDNAQLTLVDYGRFRYNGTLLDIAGGDTAIEAMAINNNSATGRAYFVSNRPLGAFPKPVLFYVDLATISPGSANLIDVTVVGTMTNATTVESMAYDASTGLLYATDQSTDTLLIINTTTAAGTTLGVMTGAGYTASTVKAMEFDAAGNLYVSDEIQDDVFRINKATGAVIAREDDSVGSGVQSMLWDPVGQRMIGFDSSLQTTLQITMGSSGANPDLANFPTPVNIAPNGTTAYDFSAVDNFKDSASDFGDFSGAASASSFTDQCLRIGATLDAEPAAFANAAATGDDASNTGSADDEDGVTMPASIARGASVTIPVTVTNTTTDLGYLHAWIDFNNDGVFNDTLVSSGGERLEAARVIATGTNAAVQNITFTVPAGASAGTQRGVRFRLTDQAVTAPTGAVGTGEVEDYTVTITAPVNQCAIVAAYYDNTIYTYSAAGGLPDGGFVTAGSGLSGPYGMKQGPDGNVYVTSSATNSIMRFNISTGLSMGAFVASGSGGLSLPYGLTWGPDGNLYVAGRGNGLIKKYNGTTGAYISDFTTSPLPVIPSWYGLHQGIVFGSDGNLYAADADNDRILKFNGTTGAFISVFATITAGDYPKGIAFGPDGNLYVVASNPALVRKINGSTGAVMGTFAILPGGASPTGLTWNATDGNLYVNALDGNVYKVNGSTGALIGPFAIVQNGGAKDIIFTNQICPPAGNCGVGNMVFVDVNGNGLADPNEDPSAPVLVQIFPAGANPQTATPIETRMTGTWGQFRFTGLAPGNYFLHIPASQFQLNAPLYGFTSLAGNGSDNGTDNNDDGIDAANPATTGISSITFNLTPDTEPVDTGTETGLEVTPDNVDDNNTDMTIDMGFKSVACSTNVVWGVDQDDAQLFSFTWPRDLADANNLKDYGSLYYSPDGSMNPATAVSLTTITNGVESFAIDKNGTAWMTTVDDVGTTVGAVLMKIDLTTAKLASSGQKNIVTIVGSVPSAAGALAGLAFDPSGQLYAGHPSSSGSRLYKLGTPGNPGVAITLVGTITGLSKTAFDVQDIEFTPDGRLFGMDLGDELVEGDETLFEISPTTGAIIGIADSAPGGGINNRPTKNLLKVEGIAWDTLRGVMTFNDDHNDMWGSFDNLTSAGNNNEGVAGDSVLTDVEGYRFMPCLTPSAGLTVGNLVFLDNNGNGKFDAGDTGANNVSVQLWSPGPDGIALNADDVQVGANTNTANGGLYQFTGLAAGAYYVRLPASNFQAGGALLGKESSIGYSLDTGDDNVNENGVDAWQPEVTGITSSLFTIASGTGPTEAGQNGGDDDAAPGDANGNLTIDFGFIPKCTSARMLVGEADPIDQVIEYPFTGGASSGPSCGAITGAGGEGMAVDARTGKMYFATQGSGLQIYDIATGTYQPYYGAGYWQSVMFSPDRKYIYAVEGYRIHRFPNNGVVPGVPDKTYEITTAQPLAPNNSLFWGVDVNPMTGDLYVTRGFGPSSTDTPGQVYRMPPDLSTATAIPSTLSPANRNYLGIAFMPDGTFWVVGKSIAAGVNDALIHFTNDGTLIATVPVSIGATGPRDNYYPWDVRLGPDGKLYFAMLNYNSLPSGGPTVYCIGSYDTVSNTFGDYLRGPTGSSSKALGFTCVNVTCQGSDYGDYSGFPSASSTINAAVHLGATVDSEAAASTNATATGDDTNGSDDEDGVLIPSMIAGATPSLYAGTNPVISIRTHNLTGANAYLNAWMDFNGNGAFDAGEQIITNYSVSTGRNATNANDNTASFSFQFNLPSTASVGVSGLRFRFNTASGAPATGAFGTGEVEDYVVNVLAPCTNLLTNGNFESGVAAQPNPKKDGDANTTLTPIPGWTFAQLTGSGGGYTVDGFDNRPAMADGMHEAWITGDGAAVVGSTSTTHMYQDVVASPGATYDLRYAAAMHDPLANIGEVRIQYLDSSNAAIAGYPMGSKRITYDAEAPWPFTGFAPDLLSLPAAPASAAKIRVSIFNSRAAGTSWDASKVSDMCLSTTSPTLDFGDYTSFASASAMVVSGLKIGAAVDAEFSETKNTSATGDDTTGIDDEDGVTLPAYLVPTVASSITVNVTNTTGASAYLNAWIDYNQNGVLTDAGEQIATNVLVTTGSNNIAKIINFTPPASASTGFLGVRVRLTSATSPGPTGAAASGEVEDYLVRVCPPGGFAYGTGTGTLYEVNVSTSAARIATTFPAGFEQANGAAFAQSLGADGVVIFSTGVASDMRLAVWDRTTGVTNIAGNLASFGMPVTEPLQSGEFYNGFYWTIIDDTDDLWKVTISGSSGSYTITAATKVADIWNNTRANDFGDIVITPGGILYGHASRTGSSPTTMDFFSVNLNVPTPSATLIGTPTVYQSGITLGLDGKLYGGLGTKPDNGDWYQFSFADGNATFLNAGSINGLTDLTIGACTPATAISSPATVDYGDYGPFAAAGSDIVAGLRMGALVDADTTIVANINATGDDITGSDDEDGATLPASITAGSSASISATVTNTSGAPAYLTAWIDFNGNGLLTDAGEKVINNVLVATGTTNGTVSQIVSVPANALIGKAGVRFRLASVPAVAASGISGNGEVEDYVVDIVCPTITVSPAALPTATVGSAYNQAITAAGGLATYTYSVTGGALPPGLALAANGQLTGTPTAGDWYHFVVTATDASGCKGTRSYGLVVASTPPPPDACPTALGQTVGNKYLVTRVGMDVRLAETAATRNQTMAMSADGRWTTGFDLGGTGAMFLYDVRTYTFTTLPPSNAANPSYWGIDVSNNGDVLGNERITASASDIPVFYRRATSLTTQLTTPSGKGWASALTSDSLYAFGYAIVGGVNQGGFWNTTANTWTTIAGTKDVIGASGDGSRILVKNNSDVIELRSGTPGTGYATILKTFAGGAYNPVISANGRYVGAAVAFQGQPFVYDATLNTTTNLPLTALDTTGAVVRAISDSAKVIGTVYHSGDLVNWAAMWPDPTSAYVTFKGILASDGHVAQNPGYAAWDLYNGGDGISADGKVMAVFGKNPSGFDDSMIFEDVGSAANRLCIGNLVFNDVNGNGVYDAATDSGIGGVVLELWSTGANGAHENSAGDDVFIGRRRSTAAGAYNFYPIQPGSYYVRIPTLPASYPLTTINVVANPNNDVNNDNNGQQSGGLGSPVYSGVLTLTAGGEPTNDGDASTSSNWSLDFGLFSGFQLGDLVFEDANSNGVKDSGEAGIPGVTVELLDGTTSALVATTTTNASGQYGFLVFTPGSYKLRVTPTTYYNAVSPVTGTDNGTDNNNDGTQPGGVDALVFTFVFDLGFGTEPGASGSTNAETTIDIGLRHVIPVSVGNLVFGDANGNGHYDLGEGLGGVTVQLYSSTQTPGASTPLFTRTTLSDGSYLFDKLLPGFYIVHIPAANFVTGGPLASTISIAEGLSGDDDVGENGINSSTPSVTGISSGVITLQPGAAPTDLNGETGFDHASDNTQDAAVDLTVDFGFANPLGVGNLVFVDANNNGHYDTGEGIAGVTVDLYRADAVPGTSIPVATQITDATGHYLFDYLLAGSYFIHMPAINFNVGGPLFGKVSMTGTGTGNADDSVDENGLDDISPITNGIRSAPFYLINNYAPTDAQGENGFLSTEDSRDDNNYNLTIDFGFRPADPNAVGVGNAVFLDANGNHVFDTDEGVNGVLVRIFNDNAQPGGNSLVATTTTANGGFYLFSNLPTGTYHIELPASNFATGAPLVNARSLPGQGGDNGIDDNQDENGDDPVSPASSGVRSTSFTLQANTEPSNTTSEFGQNPFIDDTDDDNTDLTIDFGFYRPVAVGNLVFIDASRNGRYDSGEGVNGVTL